MPTSSDRKLPFKPRLPGVERRRLIEEAAARLFAERGYAGTSLEDVAAAAGVSRPVIYDHFATKRELHEALVAAHLRALMEFVAARVTLEGAVLEERLRDGFAAFFEFMEANPYVWRIVMTEPLRGSGASAADPRLQSEVTAAVAALIQGSGARLDPGRVTRYAESLRWLTTGLASWWWDNRDVSREEVVETIMDLCWTGFDRLTSA